jgi:UDP-N-acetylmuramate--alanine ligase
VLDLDKIKKIHFIGVGGVGMSALAYVLIKRGYMVSGSDAKTSFMATKLAKEGAVIFIGHAACQVEGAEAVVVSTAIHQDNPELVEARARQIPVLHRSDVLAYLMNKHQGIAVAGAHGKTTTSSMLACITHEANVDPTVVVGGIVPSLGGNALNGKSDIVVAEADESDGSFLKFHPFYAVITNIENDHLDHYGSEEKIQEAFAQFVENIKDKGKAILCFDNAKIKALAEKTTKSFISYALDDLDADYTAKNIIFDHTGTHFDIYHKGEKLGTAHLVVPGRHNVLNALGAIATSQLMHIPLDSVLASLEKFTGAKRRFETKGRVKGVWVVDDYAHHPTEIQVTLAAAKQTKPKRLICVFQPHRYSRTKLLLNQFATCFKDCDELILADIYPASEDPIPGINTQLLADTIKKATGQKVTYIPTFEGIEKYLVDNVQAGDLVMTVGAGDGYRISEYLVKALKGEKAHE